MYNVLFTRKINGSSHLIGVISFCPGCRTFKGIVGSIEDIEGGKAKPIKFKSEYVQLEKDDIISTTVERCDVCRGKIPKAASA